MKHVVYLFFIALPILLFPGCGEDSPTESGGESQNFVIQGNLGSRNSSNSYISLFKTGGTFAVNSLASTKIDTSGEFTLAVPPPANEELETIDWMISYPIRKELDISDHSAKFMKGELVLLYNGKMGGTAQRVGVDSSVKYNELYYYFDRDVTIKGNVRFYDKYVKYDISAKKGWNIVQSSTVEQNSSYVDNIKLSESHFECVMYAKIPDSLTWHDGVYTE